MCYCILLFQWKIKDFQGFFVGLIYIFTYYFGWLLFVLHFFLRGTMLLWMKKLAAYMEDLAKWRKEKNTWIHFLLSCAQDVSPKVNFEAFWITCQFLKNMWFFFSIAILSNILDMSSKATLCGFLSALSSWRGTSVQFSIILHIVQTSYYHVACTYFLSTMFLRQLQTLVIY